MQINGSIFFLILFNLIQSITQFNFIIIIVSFFILLYLLVIKLKRWIAQLYLMVIFLKNIYYKENYFILLIYLYFVLN